MKKIEAYIRPEKLQDVTDCLKTIQLSGISISQVMGTGQQKGWKEFVRGTETDFNFNHKIKLELFILDEQLDEIIDCISKQAYTGDIGDGKIFISNTDAAIRIRTGEKDNNALMNHELHYL